MVATNTTTIGEAEIRLGDEITDLLHRVFPRTAAFKAQAEVYEGGRKKRRDASLDSWRPEIGEVRVTLTVPGPDLARSARDESVDDPQTGPDQGMIDDMSDVGDRLNDLINALNHAEERPGFDFVALKWFRDLFLPAEATAWAGSVKARDQVLRTAIQDSVVLTSKVPNPKAPSFPVTAIRLNRRHPDVQAFLGEAEPEDSGFRPVEIRGETLSDTVLRDRR